MFGSKLNSTRHYSLSEVLLGRKLDSTSYFSASGDHRTELAFQDTLRQKHNAVAALRVMKHVSMQLTSYSESS